MIKLRGSRRYVWCSGKVLEANPASHGNLDMAQGLGTVGTQGVGEQVRWCLDMDVARALAQG
jgi:hypothetical protein